VKSPSSFLGLALAAAWLTGHAGLANAQQTISAGQNFYQKVCAKCHEAGIGPVLLGRGLPPEAFQYFVRHGSGPMPAFRVTDIDDATLKELAQYLSTSKAPAGK